MRLIDADLLTQKVKGWLNTDPNSDSIMIDANESIACVLREIEEQPTAYDVDKVMEQLNEWTVNAKVEMVEGIFKNYDIINAETTIEIVKGGGIE